MSRALHRFDELGGTLPDAELVVDFGSGVGRLSQALGDHFHSVVGIDISPTMLAVADRLNRHGDRVSYKLNESLRLEIIDSRSATLVFSHITLQHLAPDIAATYLDEFLRVVKPGGAVIFQMPSHFSDRYLPADRDDLAVSSEHRSATIGIRADPGPLFGGGSAVLQVDVTNASERTWTQSAVHPLLVGNHWLDENGIVQWDDGRSRLPGRLAPGETAQIALTITAPSEPGSYRLQVDVVQEGVSWFDAPPRLGGGNSDRPVKSEISVTVEPSAADNGTIDNSGYFASAAGGHFDDLISREIFSPPQFEMNAIPRSDVEALLAKGRATLLGVDEWVDEWHSFTYYVQAEG
ncbi:MAG: class I SAM-dependent methyltransferase [Acidimicrobiales bacterium]